MMTDWYPRSINAIQLNGKGERTQEAYTRAVRMLSAFYSKPRDEIAESELDAYFLRRRNVHHWSANTMRICYWSLIPAARPLRPARERSAGSEAPVSDPVLRPSRAGTASFARHQAPWPA